MAEIEAIVKQRIADAVSESRTTLTSRTVQLVLIFGALSQLHNVASSEEDTTAISEITTTLQSGDQTQVESTVGLFLAGQGKCTYDIIGVSSMSHNASLIRFKTGSAA